MTQTYIDKKLATNPVVFTKTRQVNLDTFAPEVVFSFKFPLELILDAVAYGESKEYAIEKLAEHVKQQFLAFA